MASNPNCIFCKIVSGEVPCLKLYEDAQTLAFMDISPVHDGHCLAIPKQHYSTVFTISPRAVAAVAQTAAKIAKAVDQAVKPDGLSIMQANGPGAGQSVGHFHFHVLPRRIDDQLLFNWERYQTPGDRVRLTELAERIRSFL